MEIRELKMSGMLIVSNIMLKIRELKTQKSKMKKKLNTMMRILERWRKMRCKAD